MVRGKIAKEIMETEETYIKSLEDIMTVLIAPLRKALERKKPIISADDVSFFTEQFRPIVAFNKPFQQALRKRVSCWKFQMCLADLFSALDNKAMIEVYTRYMLSCNTTLDRFTSLCQTNKAFRHFVSVCFQLPASSCTMPLNMTICMFQTCEKTFHDEASNGCTFQSFLILPIQRPPRCLYHGLLLMLGFTSFSFSDLLLLREMRKCTPSDHPDSSKFVSPMQTSCFE